MSKAEGAAMSDVSELIERLRSFPENVLEGAPLCDSAADALEAQAVRLAEAERDAARYRWLRFGAHPSFKFTCSVLNDTPEGIDAAIDAAMEGKWPTTTTTD